MNEPLIKIVAIREDVIPPKKMYIIKEYNSFKEFFKDTTQESSIIGRINGACLYTCPIDVNYKNFKTSIKQSDLKISNETYIKTTYLYNITGISIRIRIGINFNHPDFEKLLTRSFVNDNNSQILLRCNRGKVLFSVRSLNYWYWFIKFSINISKTTNINDIHFYFHSIPITKDLLENCQSFLSPKIYSAINKSHKDAEKRLESVKRNFEAINNMKEFIYKEVPSEIKLLGEIIDG